MKAGDTACEATTTPMVYPSGLAWAIAAVPIEPLLPALFATTTGCPSATESWSVKVRPMMSAELPTVNGTMTRIARLGQA